MKTRFLNCGLVAVLALSVAAIGCGDKGDNKEKAKEGETTETTAAAEGEPAAAAATTEGAMAQTAFAVFPKNSTFLVGVNLSQLSNSPFWPMAEAQMAKDEEFKTFVAACGFNPISKVEQVLVAGDPEDEDNMIIVVKGFTKDEVKACGAGAAKTEGKTFAMADEGTLSKLTMDGESVYIAWLDDKTLVASPAASSDSDDVEAGKKALLARAAGTDGLDKNAEMMELLKNVDTSATVFAIGNLGAMKDAPMDGKVKSAFASLLIETGLKIDAGVRFADEATANQVLQKANGMKGMAGQINPALGPLAQKVNLSVSGTDLIVQANLSEADLKGLQSAAASMMPMMGGMPKQRAAKPAAK